LEGSPEYHRSSLAPLPRTPDPTPGLRACQVSLSHLYLASRIHTHAYGPSRHRTVSIRPSLDSRGDPLKVRPNSTENCFRSLLLRQAPAARFRDDSTLFFLSLVSPPSTSSSDHFPPLCACAGRQLVGHRAAARITTILREEPARQLVQATSITRSGDASRRLALSTKLEWGEVSYRE
jgi:hypothetical protein